jgi:hypothetical protein
MVAPFSKGINQFLLGYEFGQAAGGSERRWGCGMENVWAASCGREHNAKDKYN